MNTRKKRDFSSKPLRNILICGSRHLENDMELKKQHSKTIYYGIHNFLGILGALLLISAIGKIASKGTPGKRTLGIILGFTAVACFTLAKTNYDECHALSASSASLPIPEEEMLSQLKKAPTIETCQDFINTYPESRHRKDVLNIYESLAAERSLKELNMFVETYHIGWTRLQSKCDSLYSIAAKENTVDSWQKYYDTVPSGYKADAQEKIEELKHYEGWETEPIAWKKRVRTGNYEKYLDLYPERQAPQRG